MWDPDSFGTTFGREMIFEGSIVVGDLHIIHDLQIALAV